MFQTKILEIFLADTSTDEDIYMNDTLVKEGFALFTNQVNDMVNGNSDLFYTNSSNDKPELVKPPSSFYDTLKGFKTSRKDLEKTINVSSTNSSRISETSRNSQKIIKNEKQFGLKDVLNAMKSMTT